MYKKLIFLILPFFLFACGLKNTEPIDYSRLSEKTGRLVLDSDNNGAQDVPKGGTNASTLTDGGVLLGSGTGAVTAMPVLADGEMIVGDGTTDPVAESGATLRTSIGVGTGDTPQFTGVHIGSTDTTLTEPEAGELAIEGLRAYHEGDEDTIAAAFSADTITGSQVKYGDGLAVSGSDLVLDLTDGHIWTGVQEFPLLRGTLAAGVLGSSQALDQYWADCSESDPASTGCPNSGGANPEDDDYFNLVTRTGNIALYNRQGNAFFNTITTTETDFIPIGWTDITDGGSDPPGSTYSTDSNSREIKIATFDGATDEDRSFIWDVPEDITGSTIKVKWLGVVTSATGPSAEDISFQVSCISVADGEQLDFANYGTAVDITETVTEDQDDIIHSAYGTVTPTGMAGGETVHCLINRDADDTDTYAQDFGLFGVRVKYQRTHDTTF